MPDSIDDFAQRWKAKPDATGAIELCEALRLAGPVGRSTLINEIGTVAAAKYPANGAVLLAVARLYTAVERLSDAQGLLIAAGRVSPRDSAVFCLLGEVLLRRGDAERAEKVLQRARLLGANDPETEMWLDRARVFKPVQAKGGARAVSLEVRNSASSPVAPARPRFDSVDSEGVTSVHHSVLPLWPAQEEDTKRPMRPHLPPLAIPTDTAVKHVVGGVLAGANGPPARPTGPMAPTAVSAAVARPPLPPVEAPPMRAVPLPNFMEDRTEVTSGDPFVGAPVAAHYMPAPAAGPPPLPPPPMVPPVLPVAPVAPVAQVAQVASREPSPALPPVAASVVISPVAGVPSAREVLDALTNAGVYEPREAAAGPIVWDRPSEKVRRRTAIGLSIGVVLFIAGSVGVLHEINRRRAVAHEQAETTLAKVEADLNASDAALLPQIEQTIGRAFELDSRSPRAAVDWLEERTMKGLLHGGTELAFEDAMARATEVKVPEEKIAFARVSAFLFQGDTGGAAGLLTKWDGPAANEPLYQLVTGSTLEHAGDPHAVERYQAAVKLAPNLLIADLLLTRATAINGDPSKAADLSKQFRTKYPGRPEGAALVALAWARDPARGEQAPPEVAEAIAHAGDMPLPLLAVPHALQAIAALDKHLLPDAKAEIEKGLALADDPGIATWLGSLALETHDEALVRKAALLAVTFSAVYAPARVLAARIALLGGRLDEALKATEDLDPTSPDVAIVRAAAAYERADADAMGRALEAVPADARKLPVFTALNVAPDVLLGRESGPPPPRPDPAAGAKWLEMSSDEAPWSDLVAMDAALDLGLIDVADKIQVSWKGTEDKPLKAVRLSRLARYEDHLDQADHYSKEALETAAVTPRMLIERVMVLVARNHTAEVGPLLAHYPLVLGPASSWLSAYALAATNKLDEARGRTAQLDAPPALSPLAFRVVTAVSLGAMKDKKRADPVIRPLLAAGIADPDLMAAAVAVGLRPGAPPGIAGGRPMPGPRPLRR